MNNINMAIETITPEIATDYMKHNTNNFRKKISRSTVKAYADDIVHGRWEVNGEAIVFDEDGVLKNGQHRLLAVILAGVPIEILVVRGVSRDVGVYDINLRRTMPQLLAASNIDVNASVASAAGIIVNQFARVKLNGQVKTYISEHIDELNRAYRVCCYGNNKYSKNAPCIAATYLMLRTEKMRVYEVELFWRLFNDYGFVSADGYEPSPAMTARRMFDEREGKAGYQIQKERMEIVIMAMNDFHQGKKRENKYKISEPFQFMELMSKVRKEDGLEV